jgi:hypothetical protein
MIRSRLRRRLGWLALVLVPLAPAAAVIGAAPAHAGGLQLGLVSTTGFLRDSNNGGAGSPVVQAATDIDGPAENVAVNPTGTGTNVKIAFTQHAGLCVGLDSSHQAFILVSCATGIGTVFRQYTRNGGLVFDNNYADAHNGGGEWDLSADGSTSDQLIAAIAGTFFQRWQNCSGGCV